MFQSFWILVSVAAGMVFFGEYKALVSSSSSAVCFPLGVAVTIAGVYVLSQRGGGGGGHGAGGSVKGTPQQRNYRHYRAARPGGMAPHDPASSLMAQHWSSSAPVAAHGDPLWESLSHSSDSSGSSSAPHSASVASLAIPCGAATAADEDEEHGGGSAAFPAFAHSTPVSPSPAPPMSFLARSFIDYPPQRGSGPAASSASFAWQHRQLWGPGAGAEEEEEEGEGAGLQSGEESEGEAADREAGAEGRVPMSARSYRSTAARAHPPLRLQRQPAPLEARFEIDPSDLDGENTTSSSAP